MQSGSVLLFFLIVIAGILVLCGTALQWSVEDELLERASDERRHLWRYSQLLFWFAWFCAFAEFVKPNATFTAMQAALIFVIIAQRAGDGVVSFEAIDTCRRLAEDGGPAPQSAYQRCAAGGVLSYFGLVLAWLVSLPRIHNIVLQSWETVVLVLSSLMCIVGAIVLWTSDAIKEDGLRNLYFDTSMYGVFAIIFGLSAFLSDAVSVLGATVFYLTYVAASQFAVMFYAADVVIRINRNQNKDLDEPSHYAGYTMIWIGTIGILLMVMSRLLYANVDSGMVHDDNSADHVRTSFEKSKPSKEVKPEHQNV
eukprot:TRINITY_DN3601_c0_g1_i2.p1 TRINITY_DN3601_c0_g1~~TRINITY_DN3601_c0_g1_i2.p1  ORF type:complete len:310 (+),score=75.49 TRINITY_DN3601_c0_g1_i2:42-971(+)